jgi:hypothetical protein
MKIRITEHTTTDDPYCEVTNLATGEVGDWYGDAESFIAEIATPHGMTVEEIVLS